MIDKDAIQALQKAHQIENGHHSLHKALMPIGHGVGTAGMLTLPDDFKLHDLESKLANRRRARGHMETVGINSFAYYIHQHAEEGAAIFVDPNRMEATAVLNLGTPNEPGHADNLATLNANKTAAFNALLAITSRPQKQGDVAEFLEDWTSQHIICFNKNEEVATIKAILAIRNLTIETARKLQSTVEQLSSSHSSFESVKASSTNGAVPDLIYFTCDPYAGLAERQFVLRLSVTTGDSKPMLTLRIIKMEAHTEEMAQELAHKIDQVIQLPITAPKAPTAPAAAKATKANPAGADDDHDILIGTPVTVRRHIPVLIGTYRAAT